MPHDYTAVEVDPHTPPPYMDPTNSIAKKKSMTMHMVIWPAPRPPDHIRPDNTKFIGYVILIAVVIFLLFAACKYLP
ncbi:unnamed protein product [Angiostrongylus costaricensis]|uniref:Transmembrane protein n=1 Tax=Angiostrongylus costaricensis TaxID=334426 RepID=A0A0R3PTQ2_ANGCS|nr:unnamed protein product [Angiostrongylus costaricensis]